jgi:hypothetical protein
MIVMSHRSPGVSVVHSEGVKLLDRFGDSAKVGIV